MDLKNFIDEDGRCVIPYGVTKINADEFRECKSLKAIEIPDSVTEIGERAFYLCKGLTSVVIPKGVVIKIKYSAFFGCSGLTSIVIPDGVTEIGGSAFSGCKSLKAIEIPTSVSAIGDDDDDYSWNPVFGDCAALTSIKVSDNNPRYKSINNCCLSKDGTELIFGCKESVIPAGVKIIGAQAFNGCTELTSIVIPDGVTEIGTLAFLCCTGLTSIIIPDSVKKIGAYAFKACPKLTSIEIPLKCSLSEGAFDDTTDVTRRK